MKSALQFFLVLTYLILANFERATPLMGTNVRDATAGELPNVVSIGKRTYNGTLEESQLCTGTLISNRHVITAAHCLYGLDANDTVVIAGNANLYLATKYEVEKWITYDRWKGGDRVREIEYPYNDLAIVTLRESVLDVKPATVLTFVASDLYKSRLRIAGWEDSENGTAPKVLKTAVVRALTNEKCDEILGTITNEVSRTFEDYFCSQAQPYVLSTCGDSGAPLFNKHSQLVGINVGTCPPRGQLCHYPEEYVCHLQLNLHLHLHNYRHFISLTLNDTEACELARRMKKMSSK